MKPSNESENAVLCDLIGRLRKDRNDCEASEKLFSHFYPMMMGMVSRLSRENASDFDEMLEILHIALLDAAFSYHEEKGKFATYAFSCMKNRLIDYRRSAGGERFASMEVSGAEMDALTSGEDIEGDLVGRETYLSALARAKKVLSVFQYRVLVLESEGYSTAEIAGKLGATAKQVDNAKYRTRTNEKIREIFAEL